MDKYPRTLHFHFSPEVHSDDKVLHFKDLGNFLKREYVITEKMDGQNNCMKGYLTDIGEYGGVFARTHAVETQLSWDNYLKGFYHQIKYSLKQDHFYFLENLYAVHSIEYDKLDNYHFLFAIYDVKRKVFLSFDEVVAEAERLGMRHPAVIKRGVFSSMAEIQKILDYEIRVEGLYGKREGFVVRPAGEFPSDEFSAVIGKYVRKGHVQTDKHWTKNWRKAELK